MKKYFNSPNSRLLEELHISMAFSFQKCEKLVKNSIKKDFLTFSHLVFTI